MEWQRGMSIDIGFIIKNQNGLKENRHRAVFAINFSLKHPYLESDYTIVKAIIEKIYNNR